MSRNYMSTNDELHRGDFLLSNNGQWKAIFQDDGNFVIYGWKPVWASDTAGSDAVRLCMQEDCNLVMYNKEVVAKWHTNSANSAKPKSDWTRLQLTDDGKMVVTRECKEVWNSTQNRGMK